MRFRKDGGRLSVKFLCCVRLNENGAAPKNLSLYDAWLIAKRDPGRDDSERGPLRRAHGTDHAVVWSLNSGEFPRHAHSSTHQGLWPANSVQFRGGVSQVQNEAIWAERRRRTAGPCGRMQNIFSQCPQQHGWTSPHGRPQAWNVKKEGRASRPPQLNYVLKFSLPFVLTPSPFWSSWLLIYAVCIRC